MRPRWGAGLCAQAGPVRVALLTIDGTKVHANASQHATREYEQTAKEILDEAAAIDAAEDERFGWARGDERPPELTTRARRRAWLREAKRRLEQQRAADPKPAAHATRAADRARLRPHQVQRRIDRFQRRGRGAVSSEWRVITATHNLTKLWKQTAAPVSA